MSYLPARGRRWFWAAAIVSLVVGLPLGYAAWDFLSWRNRKIEWDRGTIERLCGGDTADDRLVDIQFIKEWEYKAFKKSTAGQPVWFHWRLSKRPCGNWYLVDRSEGATIRPFDERFPHGVPKRAAFNCLGQPVEEDLRRFGATR